MNDKLQVLRPALPLELVSRASGLSIMVGLTSDMVDRGAIGAVPMVRHSRKIVAEVCPAYSPCRCSEKGCLLCDSGQDGREPRRGKECKKCVLGQVAKSGFFVGEIIPATALKDSPRKT